MTKSTTKFAFLGVAERAGSVWDGGSPLIKVNIIGLKPTIIAPFFPWPLGGQPLIIAIRIGELGNPASIFIMSDSGKEIGKISVALQILSSFPVDLTEPNQATVTPTGLGWNTMSITTKDVNILFDKPGKYLLHCKSDDGSIDENIGEIFVAQVDFQKFTEEQVAAIKSNPHASKAARMTLTCNSCSSKYMVYTGFEKNKRLEEEDFIWYENAPEKFECSCGASDFDTSSIRKNLFTLLGQKIKNDGSDVINFIPQYEANSIQNISSTFGKLLDQNPNEEIIQKYIEKNLLLLHRFPADMLLVKPRISTKYTGDFGIVTPERELILIEIERADTRLLKKDGGQASPLRHAFDQVHSWLHEANEHKLAVLDSLNIDRNLVSRVRGVVIAGRDQGYDPHDLRRLKGLDQGNVTFLTYDDLAAGLLALAQGMSAL